MIELKEFASFNYNPYLNCFPAFCCSELKHSFWFELGDRLSKWEAKYL